MTARELWRIARGRYNHEYDEILHYLLLFYGGSIAAVLAIGSLFIWWLLYDS